MIPWRSFTLALRILLLARPVVPHLGLLTRERRRKSEDLGRELSLGYSVLNFANSFSESTLFLRTTTPSRPCPRPKLIGGPAWVSCVVAASTASGKEGSSSGTNPGEVGRVLSGFRLRLLPRPTEAALSLTERRERGGSGLGPRSRGEVDTASRGTLNVAPPSLRGVRGCGFAPWIRWGVNGTRWSPRPDPWPPPLARAARRLP